MRIIDMEPIRGRIKSLKKNYGFLSAEDGKDYFFHWTFLAKSSKTFNQLAVGQTVEFVPLEMESKLHAKDIKTLD